MLMGDMFILTERYKYLNEKLILEKQMQFLLNIIYNKPVLSILLIV
jgi:hypothetical protein